MLNELSKIENIAKIIINFLAHFFNKRTPMPATITNAPNIKETMAKNIKLTICGCMEDNIGDTKKLKVPTKMPNKPEIISMIPKIVTPLGFDI